MQRPYGVFYKRTCSSIRNKKCVFYSTLLCNARIRRILYENVVFHENVSSAEQVLWHSCMMMWHMSTMMWYMCMMMWCVCYRTSSMTLMHTTHAGAIRLSCTHISHHHTHTSHHHTRISHHHTHISHHHTRRYDTSVLSHHHAHISHHHTHISHHHACTMQVRYTPDGGCLAVGCKENVIDLYQVWEVGCGLRGLGIGFRHWAPCVHIRV